MSSTDVVVGDWGMIPTENLSYITYNQLLQSYADMMDDKFFYFSLFLFSYVLLNMFVFNEGARLRPCFDKLDVYYFPPVGGSVASLLFFVIQSLAFSVSLFLVMMNLSYRGYIKI